MANLNETAQWETGIYQLETSDPVMGGPDGIDNRQAKQLANRTLWLKKQTEDLQTATEGKATSATAVNAGNGLTGGGNLTASRTISLGQPGQISAQSQNAVQSSGHTHAIDTATTSRAGIVQLESSTSSQAEDRAATPKAVKAAYDKAIEAINAARGINIPSVGTASTSRAGIVMLDNSTDSQSEDRAATPKAVKAAYDKAVEAVNAARAISIPTASTSRAGIVQLADAVSGKAADAGKVPTVAAVNSHIEGLAENVLGRISQANTRIDNAVTLADNQTVTGAKIFQADIKASASTAHAAADRYIRLGADATGAYAVNSKSGKVLYLKHDGNLTYDGNRVLTEADMGRLLPVGAIVSFPRSVTNPEGFLKADGTTFNSQTFPDLFRALGNSNTLPDLTRSDIGMTAWFPIDSVPAGWLPFDDIATRVTESAYPELYRLLVAKYGRIAAVPKVADRFIRNAAQGLTVGQVQADEIKQHKHKLPTTSRPASGGTLTDWVQANETFGTTVDNGLSDNGWGMPLNDQAQTGGGETRPKALVLKLCIKAADTLGETVFWVKSNGTVNNAGALDASRLAQGLQEKADRNHTHTASQITDFSAAVSNAVNGILTGNAAENGWLKLPNGILMQWGKATIEGVHRQKEIFFPVAFREIYSIASSAYFPNAAYWDNMAGSVVIRSYAKNKFAAQVGSVYANASGSDTCILWFAVGKAA